MNDTVNNSGERLCRDATPRDRRNQLRFILLGLGWAVTLVGCKLVVARELLPEGPALWIVAVLPAIVAVFAVLAFVHYLREADELERSIQLQAMAVAMGSGFVAWSGVVLLEEAGAPITDWPLVYLIVVASYVISYHAGQRRYR